VATVLTTPLSAAITLTDPPAWLIAADSTALTAAMSRTADDAASGPCLPMVD